MTSPQTMADFQADKRRLRREKRRQQKAIFSVLNIKCPNGRCGHSIDLLCPACLAGALECSERFLTLSCNHCFNSMRHFPCPHCRFILRSSYILKKQQELKLLQEASDGSKFLATFVTFAVGFLIVWALGSISIYS